MLKKLRSKVKTYLPWLATVIILLIVVNTRQKVILLRMDNQNNWWPTSKTAVTSLLKYHVTPKTSKLRHWSNIDQENYYFKTPVTFPVDVRGSKSEKLQFALSKASHKVTILLWYAPFSRKYNREVNAKECGACEITYDRKKINQSSTRAVVFHFSELAIDTMPSSRNRHQYYVWWSEESPNSLFEVRNLHLGQYNNVFNLTMTYRRDSDIYAPYGTAENSYRYLLKDGTDRQDKKELFAVARKKKKFAMWITSSCGTRRGANKRMRFVKILTQRGLKLDKFGSCFSAPYIGPDKMENFIKNYKFYLAFENVENCKDYVSEKFFTNALMYGAVPVVYGARKSDYDAVAPPKSYIYAKDFTVDELVAYMNYLDTNTTAYLEYFHWRTLPMDKMPNYGRKTKWCQLCRMLYGIDVDTSPPLNLSDLISGTQAYGFSPRPRVVPSIREWFYGQESEECLSG
ncbi:unnamed protein product [Clavelina lepadiformis]|uniref:Fucosyltransferase n=1 Tax=Clavelina lepadiformis TaxID=159417 RepID=A0ABP0G4X6_CLALP